MPDFAAIKARQQQAWATGDYAMIGHNVVLVSELLCHAVDLRAGQRVLDVATGSGHTALAAARHWCDVTGIDYVPTLLERAKERAAAERLLVTFRAFEGLPAEQQEHLSRAMLENIQRFNQSGDETMVVPSAYLEVVATKR